MFRPASRLIARSSAARAFPRVVAPTTRRFLSTAPPTQKSRSWKSLFARLGAAGAIIYYYNTTDVFAEEPARRPVQTLPETDSDADQFLTIDALTEERRKRKAEAEALVAKQAQSTPPPQEGEPVSDVEGLEEEADQQGAFNPETGEINWDCPCLGGMANGPCGEEFKAAFSCFVHSTEEPKGMDCVDKFKNMQNCFREYPEVYGSELETEDEDDMTSEDQEQLDAPITASDRPSESSQQSHDREARQQRAKEATEQVRQDHGDAEKQYVGPASSDKSLKSDSGNEGKKQRAKAAAQQVKKEHEPLSESDEVVPKAWHDETAANAKKQ